jgi:hypothetical protein
MSETKTDAADPSDAPDESNAQEQADFAGGFDDGKPSRGKAGKPDKADRLAEPATAEAREAPAEAEPEYARLTTKELAELRAVAAKTASYDSQLAKAWGSIGNLNKLWQEAKAAAAPAEARKVELPKEAFAEMERDFPELAAQIKAALETSLSRIPTGGAHDAEAYRRELAEAVTKREIEALEDAYPSWREITGAVDVSRQEPDPNNKFRAWLATKDADYQRRVNTSESAAVISRAIRTFQRETAPQAKPVNGTPRSDARADRFRSAVQPRGDNASGGGPNSDQDEFEAGFNAAH